MRRTRKRLWTGLVITASSLVILLAIIVGSVRILDQLSPRLRNNIAQQLSAQIERPVSIGQLDLGWRHGRPAIVLRDCAILTHDHKGSILTADELAIAISWSALLEAQLRPAALDLSGFTLGLEWQSDGSLSIRDIRGGPLVIDYELISNWAGRIGTLNISHSVLEWYTPGVATPQRMTGVNLQLDQHGTGYSLHAGLQLPPAWGQSAEFNAEAIGKLSDFKQLQANITGTLEGIKPQPWLLPYLKPNIHLTGAQINAQLQLELTGLQPRSMQLEMQAQPGQVHSSDGKQLLATLPAPSGQFSLRHGTDGSWLLRIQSLQFGTTAAGSGKILFHASKDGLGGDVNATFDQLDLQGMTAWAAIFQGTEALQLPYSGASGELRNLAVAWHSRPQKPDSYRITAALHQLSLPAAGQRPGVSGLSGQLEADADGGQLKLNIADGKADIPAVFDHPIVLKPLTGTLSWAPQEAGWLIHGKDLQLQLPGLQANSDFSLLLPTSGSPVIHLKGTFSGTVAAARPFVPHPPVLNADVQHWLQHSILKGKASHGIVELDGALADFPYTEPGQQGHFLVAMQATGAVLDYAEGWPQIHNIDGSVRIAGLSLQVKASKARMLESDVGPVSARIDNLNDPHLIIDGVAANGVAKQFSFLSASPLRDDYQKLTNSLRLQGPSTLYLHLNLPLANMDKFQVDGRVALKGVTLYYDNLSTPVTDITGELAFNQNGLHADHLSGKVLGLPTNARLTPAQLDGRQGVRLEAELQISLPEDAKALSQLINPVWLTPFSGSSRWRLSSVLFTDGKPSNFQLLSDLVGTRIKLGAPFAKPAQTAMPAVITYTPQAQGFELFARLGSELKTRMAFATSAQGQAQLQRGIIQLGDGDKPELPGADGIWLSGSLPELDVDASAHFFSALSSGKPDTADDSSAADLLRGGQVHFDVLRLASQSFNQVDMQLRPTLDGWRMHVSGPDANGNMQWHGEGRGLLEGSFDLLRLQPPQDEAADAPSKAESPHQPERADVPPDPVRQTAKAFDPAGLPSLKLEAKKMLLGNYALGQARFDLAAIDHGVQVQTAQLSGGGLQINAQGQWLRQAGQSRARLSSNISTNDIKTLIKAAGFSPSLSAEKTRVNVDVNWQPNAAGLTYDVLNGKLNFNLENGALLEVEPGSGRVLALMNFYALPKRLLLNFKDVVGKGTQFDSLQGSFKISHGIATTHDMSVDSSAMSIRVNGSVDLGKRLYNQTVTVTPKLDKAGDTVALAGAAIGGPVVGLAIYLVKEILDRPVDNLARITYHLGGSFSDPKISEVSAQQAEKQAAPAKPVKPVTPAPSPAIPAIPPPGIQP